LKLVRNLNALANASGSIYKIVVTVLLIYELVKFRKEKYSELVRNRETSSDNRMGCVQSTKEVAKGRSRNT
jgi:hypothetical protein